MQCPTPRATAPLTAIVAAGFLIGWLALLVTTGPQFVVDLVGTENAYAIAFLFAALGGFSSLTAGPFYAAIGTFAAGGADPLILGALAGTGITIGDSLFFYLGRFGLTRTRLDKNLLVARLRSWLLRVPEWSLPLATLGYTALTPLPNDVLMVALGFLRQRAVLILPFVLVGNIVHMTLLTTGASLLPGWLGSI